MIAINLARPVSADDIKKAKRRVYAREWYRANRQKWVAYDRARDRVQRTADRRAWRAENPENVLLASAKRRAKEKHLPFDLVLGDIAIPDTCPALGIPLSPNRRGMPHASSPSLDRIVPEYGYVRGNVRVISHRANTIKSNATAEELRAVLRYLESADVDL